MGWMDCTESCVSSNLSESGVGPEDYFTVKFKSEIFHVSIGFVDAVLCLS